MTSKTRSALLFSILLLSFNCCGCGGAGGPTASLTSLQTIVMSGGAALLTYGCTNATSATASSAPVDHNWSGSVSLSDTTAIVVPTTTTTPTTYTLTCTNSAGSSSASVTITVGPPFTTPTVIINPEPEISVPQNMTYQFTTLVYDEANTQVTWSVDGISGGNSTIGTIVNGLYTAPLQVPTPDTVIVTATLAADTTKSDSTEVVISP